MGGAKRRSSEWSPVLATRAGPLNLARKYSAVIAVAAGALGGSNPLGAFLVVSSLLGLAKLQPHGRHAFEGELAVVDGSTHVRLNIHPDGGIARLRLFGTATAPAR